MVDFGGSRGFIVNMDRDGSDGQVLNQFTAESFIPSNFSIRCM